MKKFILLTSLFYFHSKVIHAQPGRLDSSFGINGIVKKELGKHFNYSFGNTGFKTLFANDGSLFTVIEANGETLICKRHADGSVDSSYKNKGFSDVSDIRGADAVMQPDGKIIAAGSVNNGTSGSFAIVRYNTDGSLDNSFSGDGKQTTLFDSNAFGYSFATSVALQNDGKIVAAGYAQGNFAIARYNADGSPDSSFSNDGIQTTDFGNQTNFASSVVMQNDNKIVVAGYIWNGTDYDFALARYNTDGSPDSTFSGDGKQTTSFGGNDYAYSAVIQSDGKIVVAGYAGFDTKSILALARYNTDGALDSTFGNEGKQTTDYGSIYSTSASVALQNDHKIIVAYYIHNGSNFDFAASRYNTDGSLDSTFGNEGKQTTDFNGGDDYTGSVAIQNDGKIVLTGQAALKDLTPNFALCRYNSNGSIDNTFGKNGIRQDKFKQGNTVYNSIAVQKDGKVVAAGYTWIGNKFDFALTRYNTDGTPDLSFSGDGNKTTSFGAGDDYGYAVAIQDDGKIVVVGSASDGENNDFAFARYETNGEPDKTFNGNGKKIVVFGSGDNHPNAVAIQNDGKIVAAGTSKNLATLVRLTPDGNPDPAFSGDGKQTTDFGSGFSAATSIALQSDGKIVVAGTTGERFTLARYNTDGNLDQDFADKGKLVESFAYQYNSKNSVAIQSDGKIVLAADMALNEATTAFLVARFDQNGKADNTFGENGIAVIDSTLSYSSSVAIQGDGKILVGGGRENHSSITRLNSNGMPDSRFGDNGKQIIQISGTMDGINDIAIVNDSLYAAGTGDFPGNLGVVTKYLLNEPQTPPIVNLITPTNNAIYLSGGNVYLNAAASDSDGTITKVEFYNGADLLFTATDTPYTFKWEHVLRGDYTLTAKATDNSGLATTSAPVHISVVPNKPPTVSIINPANGQSFTAPATINFEATAQDADGRVVQVSFYNGTTLLTNEHELPYTYQWQNVPAGVDTITAVAKDNWGAETTSAPIIITVTSGEPLAGGRQSSADIKADINDEVSLQLLPNPAGNILNINTTGLQNNKRSTISVISTSGVIIKTIQINAVSSPLRGRGLTQLNVSSLASGMYIIKVISGDTVIYSQFIKK